MIKGDNPGEFLYGKYVFDDEGNPEKAYYDFSKGKMWSVEVKKVEGAPSEFTWN